MWRTHGKVIMQLLGAAALAVFATIREVSSGGITASEWIVVIIAAFTVVNVWGAANIPGFQKAKTIMGAIGAALTLLVTLVTGGIHGDEWIMLAITVLTALGVAGASAVKHAPLAATASRTSALL